jgi:methyl coenzyme M reductase gamma subunit
LDAVNVLCDKLLPKVVKVTHGGSIDVPARKYLASWPAHDRLLKQFDADLAAVSVPPLAQAKAAAFARYVKFADRLDAARLKAAHRGQAAYAKEVQAESGAADDPAITALTAAGFNESCTAR